VLVYLTCRGSNEQDVIGLVLVKELLQFWRSPDSPRIGQLDVRYMPHIPADTPMFDVLRLFQVRCCIAEK
jgi:CBS domain containing-hemolysin-like protein